ncbi:hypothetical protein JHD48_10235 [Sulfurimonas sp. SAG-AH-194-I05]|nr:hypothetical protein [Sulfurimonas sp. SAG-AH-194-I05]MDF1876110.1 hypothetical protein [Sulfurimonas sp. SAG-AH-194-I05]
MKKIVSDIHNAIQNSRKTIEFLTQNSSFFWAGDYPIAIVHEVTRIKDETSLKNLEKINFFNTQGFSKNTYTKKELNYLKDTVPDAIKTSYCLCLKKSIHTDYNFEEKFEHDRWKKVKDEDNFVAFVEFSKCNDSHSNMTIETTLRDIMRSTKEIPSLKTIGFVWIVSLPKVTNIENILQHYFLDNHIYVEHGRKITYIAWADKLAEINMRYFVNTPIKHKRD